MAIAYYSELMNAIKPGSIKVFTRKQSPLCRVPFKMMENIYLFLKVPYERAEGEGIDESLGIVTLGRLQPLEVHFRS